MDANGLREIYDHHAWALDQVFARALELPPDRAAEGSRTDIPSLLDTLAHIVTAEGHWLQNWQERDYSVRFQPEGVASVARAWMTLQAEMRAFLAGLAGADLARPIRIRQPIGGGRDTLGAGVLHVLLHGAQHRAEAALLLTDDGHSPGELDYIDFLAARQALLPDR